MKIKIVYKLFFLAVLFVGLQSRSTGPGGTANLQVTGAPGSVGSMGTCANTGCHTAGSFDPSLSITLLDGNTAVTEYLPGKTYTLRIQNTPGSGNPARYGFQAVSLDDSDIQAGDWGALGTAMQTVQLSGRNYVEHSSPSTVGSFEVEWMAPANGQGNVTFYSASAATNGNGGTTGDGTAASSLTVSEAPTSSTLDPQRDYSRLMIAPNPVTDQAWVEVASRNGGDYELRLVNVHGQVVHTQPENLRPGVNRTPVQLGHLPAGLYVVQLCGETHVAAGQLLKR